MRKLIRQIKEELKTAKHCAIYEEELDSVWPDDGKGREVLLAQLVKDNGFRLRLYRDGLCAIFDKSLSDTIGTKTSEGLRLEFLFSQSIS
jgi:hypothetical protein